MKAFFGAGITSYLTGSQTESPISSEAETAFNKWISENGKSYGTHEEYAFRLEIFARKMAHVERHNAENADDAELALNFMADWTPEEYQKMLGYKANHKHAGHKRLGGDDHDRRPHGGRKHRGKGKRGHKEA